MKHFKRVIAVMLTVSMLAGFCAVWHVPRQAKAADDIYYTTENFQKDYAKVLLGLIGKGYTSGGGYHVTAGGTPLNPATTPDTMFDCSGFVITGLMMMGYDYFIDSTGKKWDLNAQVGMDVFQGTKGIFYSHKTGDKITLHNKTDARFNVTFEFGEVVDMTKATDIPMGSIICSLPTHNSAGNYDSSNNNGVVYGAFSEHYIGSSYKTYIGHVSVALFTIPKGDDITPENYRDKTSAERKAALENSWERAAAKIESLFGATYKTKVTGGSIRNSAYNISEQHYAPFLWDARGRGYGYYTNSDATASNYKAGFKDPRCSKHFLTQYSNVWQIECLNETVGVCVNNNPYGKTVAITQSVLLKPVDSYGDIVIHKTEDKTQTVLSGAGFTLYEWSNSSGKYVESLEYKIKEYGTSGTYRVYKGNDQEPIIITDDNHGQIKVVETKAPPGYSNIDPATGQPYTWEYTFPKDGGTVTYTIDAKNTGVEVGFNIVKKGTNGPLLAGGEFTLYSDEACQTVTRDLNGTSVFVSGTDGKKQIKFRLKSDAQTYYLKETKAPGGYIKSDSVFRITVTAASDGRIVVAEKKAGASAYATVSEISAENAKQLTKGELPVSNTPETGGLTITKKTNTAVDVKEVYWFYITGPGYTAWKSITLQPGQSSASVTIPNLTVGEYTVLEVEKDGDTKSVSETRAVPYSAVGEGKVTVVAGTTVNKTITNMITTVRIKKTAK
jgi:hypothetical protein